jgi:hypothetical protein
MAPLGRFAQIAHDHLKEHLPKVYRELQEMGQLWTFVEERGAPAKRLLEDLVGDGVAHDAAWEEASRELYLPAEADEPELDLPTPRPDPPTPPTT